MRKSIFCRTSQHFSMVIFLICIALPCNLNALDNLVPLDQKVNVHESTRALTNSLHVSSDSSCEDAGNQYCKKSIQAAINDAPTQCSDPCTIKIGTGQYGGQPYLNSPTTVILEGGWNFTSGTKSTGAKSTGNLNALDNLVPLDQKVNVHESTRALTNSSTTIMIPVSIRGSIILRNLNIGTSQ